MCYSFHAFVLQFRMNEFGIMEMVTDDVEESKPTEKETDKTETAEGEGTDVMYFDKSGSDVSVLLFSFY